MAKIEKLPSGSYRMRVYDKRTKKRKSITASSIREVKRLASEYQIETDAPLCEHMTVSQCIEAYIANRTAVTSPSTIRGYTRMSKNHFNDIGHLDAALISSEDVQRHINLFAVGHSPKTVKNSYGLLSAALRAFYPDKHINVTLPQKNVLERHIPTDGDVKKLIAEADHDLLTAILLASTGTLRRGEICALKHGDVSGNTIHVHASMVCDNDNAWICKDVPKTSASDRYVEFPESVIAQLGTGDPDEFIVKSTPQAITNRFCHLRTKLGMQCKFHDLRHYAASIMHAIGVPDQYIMERGGWSSDSVLKSIYRNTLDDQKKKNTDKTNAYMSSLLSGDGDEPLF